MLSISFIGICLVTAVSIGLGLLTLLNNHRQITNRIFAVLCWTSGIYVLVNFLADHDPVRGLFWVRGTFFLGVIMVYCMLAFVARFPKRVISARAVLLMGIGAAIIGTVTWLPSFIPAIIVHDNRSDVVTGPLYGYFLFFLVTMFAATVVTISIGLRRSNRLARRRAQLVFGGLVITTVLIALTNIVLPLVQGANELAGLGSYFILVFTGLSTYAVVRDRLFDIRLAATRSVAYLALLSLLAAGYVVVFYGLSNLFITDPVGSRPEIILSAALALVLALSFQPLRRLFEHLTDRIFYRDHYDSAELLLKLNNILVRELDLQQLLHRSLRQICSEMRIGYGQLIIFRDGKIHAVEHFGHLPKRLIVAPQLRRLNRSIIVADELDDGEYKTILEYHGLRLSAILKTHGETVGYLLLGDKLSGDVYSSQDIDLIGIMAQELAVAVSNAQAYAEIQAFAATLQERVNHATGRLRVANRHLKELDRVKDEFISMASHQLRTPLTTIKGYLSMILEGDAGRIGATQREFTEYAFISSERMVHLISDLLDVSRLSAGRFMIQSSPVDLGQLVAGEVKQLEQHAKDKNLGLELKLPDAPLPPMMLDETKTRQVVMNFIDNAIYYTKEGAVMVTVTAKAGTVRLEVRDTGIGVPEAAKKHLFSKFYRAENAQEVRPDGTGLGLYLAKRVVEDQGGTIVFSSTEGKGSMFGFELPIVLAPTATAKTKVSHG